MANKKITELTALTAPAITDIIAIVDDPSGSPETKKMTLDDMMKVVDGLSAMSTRPDVSDTFLVLDAGDPKKVTKRNLQVRYVQLEPFSMADQTDCVAGTNKAYLHIPADIAGLDLVECHAEVQTAGTTGTMTIDVNIAGATALSTKLTIDTDETGSDTAATAYVIDTAADDVAENDVVTIDIDGVHTTAAKGLIVTLGFA